jgi:hypothetical protein
METYRINVRGKYREQKGMWSNKIMTMSWERKK